MGNLNKKIAILAICAALMTSFFIYIYLSGMGKEEAKVETTVIYAAKETIAAKTVIKEAMLIQVKVPIDANLPMGITDKSKIIGKITKERIIKGEPILQERLYGGEKNTTMAYAVPKGKRAVTIGVNEVTEVGDFIIPGDYVDIIATFGELDKDFKTKKVNYPKFTKIILQNVLVLGVGQNMSEDKKTEKKLPTSVTLAVTPEEAEKLVLADESGVLRLALRPVSEAGQVNTGGVIRDDMVLPKGKIEY